jgi:hypothetical protein
MPWVPGVGSSAPTLDSEPVPGLMKYGERFAQEIRAAGARPVLFMTWARKDRPASQDSLTRSYLGLGRHIRAVIVPVGPTWASGGSTPK